MVDHGLAQTAKSTAPVSMERCSVRAIHVEKTRSAMSGMECQVATAQMDTPTLMVNVSMVRHRSGVILHSNSPDPM